MLCANQEQLRTVLAFLADAPPVLCDWLPWNHTFGGNHNFYKIPYPVDQLTRIKSRQVRSVEIGFRTTDTGEFIEPLSYEWNAQHREGRFQRMPEETLMLTGDQNMIELSAVVHYDLSDPAEYIFRLSDSEATVRVAAESILHSSVNASPLDSLLTTDRREFELRTAGELQQRLDGYQTGIRVLSVRLQEVHPSVEVVDAFREVAGALEEKSRLINEAEGYRNEQVALARGQAEARLRNADGYKIGRTNRADGDATRFIEFEQAARNHYAATATRLYLETMEEVLPGRQKLIVDSRGGRKSLYSIEDGINLAPPGVQMTQPPPFVMPREE
jgi:HflK protein